MADKKKILILLGSIAGGYLIYRYLKQRQTTTTTGGGGSQQTGGGQQGGGGGTTTGGTQQQPQGITVFINNQCPNPVTIYYTDVYGNNKTYNPPSGISSIEVKENSTISAKDSTGKVILQPMTITYPTTLLLCPGGVTQWPPQNAYSVFVNNLCQYQVTVSYVDYNGKSTSTTLLPGETKQLYVQPNSTLTITAPDGTKIISKQITMDNDTVSTTWCPGGGGAGGSSIPQEQYLTHSKSWYVDQVWQRVYNYFLSGAPTSYDSSQVQYYVNKYKNNILQIISNLVDEQMSYLGATDETVLEGAYDRFVIAYQVQLYYTFSSYPCYTDCAYMQNQCYQYWPYWMFVAMTLSKWFGDTSTYNSLKQQFESQYMCKVCYAVGKPCGSGTGGSTTTSGGGGGGGGGTTTTQTYSVTIQNYCDLNMWAYYIDANGNQQQQFIYIGSVSTINVRAGSTVTIKDELGNTVYSSAINSNTTIKTCTVFDQCKVCS